MNKLKGKKILFFSPKFFGYEEEIELTLKKMGAIVKYYDDRPGNDFLTKVLIRLNKKFLKNKIMKYYNKIIKETEKNTYDYIFFLTPDSLTLEILLELKKRHKKSKFILYMWDSLENRKNVFDLISNFNKVYSFDKKDSRRYNFNFRPLFYIDGYKINKNNKNNYSYDLSFIGTGHSDRYKMFKIIKEKMLQIDSSFNFFSFMYFPNKILYMVKKVLDKDLRKSRYKEFNFKSLNQNEIINIISKSKIILDIQHPKQNGLTMRTFEMLGMEKKLITTNQDVKNYDFYNKNNILIVDRENPKLDIEFFKSNYEELPQKIYDKYSIESWIKEILLD